MRAVRNRVVGKDYHYQEKGVELSLPGERGRRGSGAGRVLSKITTYLHDRRIIKNKNVINILMKMSSVYDILIGSDYPSHHYSKFENGILIADIGLKFLELFARFEYKQHRAVVRELGYKQHTGYAVNLAIKTIVSQEKSLFKPHMFCNNSMLPADGDDVDCSVFEHEDFSLLIMHDNFDFREEVDEDLEVSSYYLKGNHDKFLDFIWNGCNNSILVSVSESSFGILPLKKFDKVFGKSESKIEEVKNIYDNASKDDLCRTYMLIGPPGTGKSSVASIISSKYDLRVLKLVGVRDIDRLFFSLSLRPSILVIDDFDRFAMDRDLDLLEMIKQEMPKPSLVLLTANDINHMDNALVRPGRIDDFIEFDLPDFDDRKDIISRYINEMNISASEKDIEDLSSVMEGFSGAYLKEYVYQLKYDSADVVHSRIKKRMKYLDKNTIMEANEWARKRNDVKRSYDYNRAEELRGKISIDGSPADHLSENEKKLENKIIRILGFENGSKNS